MHHLARHRHPPSQARLDALRPARRRQADHERQRNFYQLSADRQPGEPHLGLRRSPRQHRAHHPVHHGSRGYLPQVEAEDSRTDSLFHRQACQFYVASFWLLPVSFDVFMPPPTINPAQVPPILRHISVMSGAEAVFKSNCFEFHGLESQVRQAVQLVLELDFVKVGPRYPSRLLEGEADCGTSRFLRLSTTRSASRSNSPTSTAILSPARRTASSTRS